MPADPIWGQLILQVILIAVNAFFAAAEIAVISLDENKLRVRAENGDKDAVRMLKLVSSPSGFLSTIQIAITLAGFLGSAFAADHFAGPMVEALMKTNAFGSMNQNVLNTVCVILITIILSYFTLVFGELVPKRVAMQKTDAVAKVVSGVILGFSTVMKPLVWLLTVSTNGVLRLCRIDPNAQEDSVTEQDIRMMADLGEEKGSITETEGEMIDNIFEFNNHTAFDVMTHRTEIAAVEKNAKVSEVVALATSEGFSRLPVYEKDLDNILGFIHVKDLLCLLDRQSPGSLTIADFIRPVLYVPEHTKCRNVFAEFKKSQTAMAVVVDEYGGTEGIITMEDILEAIVGEIEDEYDEEEKTVQDLGDGTYLVEGTMELEDLSELLKIPFEEDEDYDTLGGFMTHMLGRIPKEGETPGFTYQDYQFTVAEVEERRVAKVKIQKLSTDEPEEKEE
mgnify:FL=1